MRSRAAGWCSALGAGWNETEFGAFGYPFDRRVARFAEAFTIIATLLRDGAIDFDGAFYQARDCELVPRPARPGGPPILIGSNGERMLRIALPHAAAWNSWFTDFGNAPDGIAPLRETVDAAARDVGRDPAAIERTVAVLVQLPGGDRPGSGRRRQAAARADQRPARGDRGAAACVRGRRHHARPAGGGSDHGRVRGGARRGAGTARRGLIGGGRRVPPRTRKPPPRQGFSEVAHTGFEPVLPA